jgi:ATP-dependent DNA helicase RecG
MAVAQKESTGGSADARPAVLFPLFASVRELHGVGPDLARRLGRLLGTTAPRVLDLVAHRPSGWLDPTPVATLERALAGEAVTVEARILGHEPPRDPRRPWRVHARTVFGTLEIVFFQAARLALPERLPEGSTRRLHGRVGRYREQLQLTHPEILGSGDGPTVPLALYPLVEGLSHARLRGLVARALERIPALSEWQDPAWIRQVAWPSFAEALRALHEAGPGSVAEAARRRLAFDELLATQLALALLRRERDRVAARPAAGDPELRARLLGSLPFQPTGAQLRAIDEIAADLGRETAMLRLLQGDVGSGKTLVALAAMLTCAGAGRQAALMAPTEVLAAQHAATLGRLLAPLGRDVELLLGRHTTAQRRAALERIESGAASLVVGTHALLQEGVRFADLGLAVIDEQHRFGVGQRLALTGKGGRAHLLLLTATPIPRTLVLGLYGEIATSRLDERPPGRRPVATRAVPLERLDEVLDGVARALQRGERLYWICPSITAEEPGDAAVEARAAALRARFGQAVGMVHGKLKAAEKDAAMAAFAEGRVPILVATTVVEVGVDVPEASVIVIEGAERFGLAQLHQLRGRVGRGARPSSCVLLYQGPLGEVARARLATIRRTDDGFAIAEEDLRLRGPGEVLGARQSGLPAFRFAELASDADLLDLASREAARIARSDPGLRGARGPALRLMLHVFERHDATRLLAAG